MIVFGSNCEQPCNVDKLKILSLYKFLKVQCKDSNYNVKVKEVRCIRNKCLTIPRESPSFVLEVSDIRCNMRVLLEQLHNYFLGT